MPKVPAAASTDGTSDAQGRFTISLTKELGASIDKLSESMATAMRQQYGIGVKLSRAQVVTSVVESALAAFESGDAGTASDES